MISEVLVFPGSILLWRRNTEVPWKPKPRPPVGAGIRGYASLGRPCTGRRWRNSLPITWSISGALWLKASVKAKALWQHQPGRPGPSETHEKSMRNPLSQQEIPRQHWKVLCWASWCLGMVAEGFFNTHLLIILRST